MYFQLEIDYHSNEANKKKIYKLSVKSINKKQRNLKIRLKRALYLQRELVILCWLNLKVLCCLELLVLESIFFKCKLRFFEQGRSRSIFKSIRYMEIKTNKVIHNAGSQVYPLYIIHKYGAITLAWAHCIQS